MKQLYYKVGILLGIFKSEDFVKASQVIAKAIEIFKKVPMGLCRSLTKAFIYYDIFGIINGEDVHKILHKFNPGFLEAKYTHTNLMENPFYIGSPCWGKYWWDAWDYHPRLNALNKLYKYYLAHDILIKKSDHTPTV